MEESRASSQTATACHAHFHFRFAADDARPDAAAVLAAWALRERERTGQTRPWDDALRALLLERLEAGFDDALCRRFDEGIPPLSTPVWTTTEIDAGPHGLSLSVGLLAGVREPDTSSQEALRGRRAALLLGELRALALGCLETLGLAGVITVTTRLEVHLTAPETALVPALPAPPGYDGPIRFYPPVLITEAPPPPEPEVAARQPRRILERGFVPLFVATLLFGTCAYLAAFSVAALWQAITMRVDTEVERQVRSQTAPRPTAARANPSRPAPRLSGGPPRTTDRPASRPRTRRPSLPTPTDPPPTGAR